MFCGLKGRVLWRGGEEGNSKRSGVRMTLRAKPEWLVLEKGTDLHFSELGEDMCNNRDILSLSTGKEKGG